MFSCLGIDTSNYTTSVALYDNNGLIDQVKKLLYVKSGELGLRQSDAVFQHIQQLPLVISDLMKSNVELPIAIGVSISPRDIEGSYMPCFTVGTSIASILSSVLKIPLFKFSHQNGHIAAALYSANRMDLVKKIFLAFHVSGGTTEAVLVTPNNEKVIASKLLAYSLDLNAGQVIDRVGRILGLDFPAGPSLDKLACMYEGNVRVKPVLKGFNCCLSGLENICFDMNKKRESKNKIAYFCIKYIEATLDFMCERLLNEYKGLPVLFSGGVMSNTIIKNSFESKYDAIFATPQLSADNAVGIAALTHIKARDM